MKKAFVVATLASLVFLVLTNSRPDRVGPARGGDRPTRQEADLRSQVKELRSEIKKLQGLVPDQAAVMSRLGYHWSNLWFALERENWPLADFYLAEVRSNLKWAVRVRPERVVNKEKVDLKAIAEALDNTQLNQLKTAIANKDRTKCVKLYDEALQGCYACHKASDKPYLRPRRPTAPEVRVINFDPGAKGPS